MITMLCNKIEEGLKSKLDGMEDNYDRANYLATTFEEGKLPEDLQEPIIKWFLYNYRDK